MTKFFTVRTADDHEPVMYATGSNPIDWTPDREQAGMYTIWKALQICACEEAYGIICVYEEEYSLADKLAELAACHQWRHDGRGYTP